MHTQDLPLRLFLLKSSRLFTDRINQILSPYDLNYSFWQVLYVIKIAQQSTLVEIAHELKISQPAVTKRIFELDQKGHIDFIISENRREKIVCLSPKGQQTYEQCRVLISNLEAKYCQGIHADDIDHLKKTLGIFLDNMLEEDQSHD